MALLTDAEIAQGLPAGWEHRDGVLVHERDTADFAAAMAFANAVAVAAEAANHHPDILVHGWNHVRLTLSTHSEGGVTAADLALAATLAEL
jgi:4a-hydroxytetrahydrobiopterin dehydratase